MRTFLIIFLITTFSFLTGCYTMVGVAEEEHTYSSNEIEDEELSGTIVAVPVVNVPAFTRKMRRFNDGVDINHIMPGKEKGNVSNVYAFRLIDAAVDAGADSVHAELAAGVLSTAIPLERA